MYEPTVSPPFVPPPPPPPVAQKHSTMGIISLVLAILAVTILCVDMVLIVGIIGGTNISNITPQTQLLDAGLSCVAAIMAVTGLGLGIAAVLQKNTKRLFPILGLVFNSLYLIGYCGLVAINLLNLSGTL